MAQPYFTNQPVPIQQVSPELLMAPGRAMGRAFEKLGQSVGVAMERQYQKQEKARRADELENYLIGQGIDPDMAKSLKNDKELALNKLKLDQENEKFQMEKDRNDALNRLTIASAAAQEEKNKAQIAEALIKKKSSEAYKAFKEGRSEKVVETMLRDAMLPKESSLIDLGAQWQPSMPSTEPIPESAISPEDLMTSGGFSTEFKPGSNGHYGADQLVLERELAAQRGDDALVKNLSSRIENMTQAGLSPTQTPEMSASRDPVMDDIITTLLMSKSEVPSGKFSEEEIERMRTLEEGQVSEDVTKTVPLKGEELIKAVSDEFELTGEQYKAFTDLIGQSPAKLSENIKIQQALATLDKTTTEAKKAHQQYIASSLARDFSSVNEPIDGPQGRPANIFPGKEDTKALEFKTTQAKAEAGIELFDQAIEINKRFEALKTQAPKKGWDAFKDIPEAKKLMEVSKSIATQIIGENRLDLLGPGALTEADIKLLNDAIGDPTKMFDLFGGNSAKLRALRQKIINVMETKERSFGWKRKKGMEIGTNYGTRKLGEANMDWFDDPQEGKPIKTETNSKGETEATFSSGNKATIISQGGQ
jgi:hypothetical protein